MTTCISRLIVECITRIRDKPNENSYEQCYAGNNTDERNQDDRKK